MMKSGFICKVILAVIFCVLAFLPLGCSSEQLGETTAEGSRRHERVLRINQSELMSDIDKALLFDQPSKLTDKRIP
jgi:branched-subunit amino acid permease